MRLRINDNRWFAFMSPSKCYNSWEGNFKTFTITIETYREWRASSKTKVIGPEILGGWG